MMHHAILQQLRFNPSTAAIPDCHQYVTHDSHHDWWANHLPQLPSDFQVRCNILITDRIPPFPKTVRETLIDLYYPDPLKSSIKSSSPDENCLIRPYLGRRRRLEKQSRFKAFSLRNHPLHLDQIEELGLDGTLYARIMAETLAVLYWKAQIDANDVEFVLHRQLRFNQYLSKSRQFVHLLIKSESLGDHVVWILDFDCCRFMSTDEKGVEQAANAFHGNDPFYPRPSSDYVRDLALWIVFKERFLKASEAILQSGSREARLPTL